MKVDTISGGKWPLSYPGLGLIWSRKDAHTSQLFGGMPWKTKWDQFVTLTLLKSHSGVLLSHIYCEYEELLY